MSEQMINMRQATARTREGGWAEVIRGLALGGFAAGAPSRLQVIDNPSGSGKTLMITFGTNVGTASDYSFVGIDVFISLTDAELAGFVDKKDISNEKEKEQVDGERTSKDGSGDVPESGGSSPTT